MTEIDTTIDELYRSICFRKGETPDLDKLTSVFTPDGKLIDNNGDTPHIMTVSQFSTAFTEQIGKRNVIEFEAKEIAHRTEIFGKIAHRFSTYETRLDLSGAQPASVGINSIQLLKTGEKWLVTSLVWNDQTDTMRIPDAYLK